MLRTGYCTDRMPSGFPMSIFAKRGEMWYRALPHAEGRYHGSPVTERLVPPDARSVKNARWVR